ncbi:MAG: hypothetical protein RL143_129 [Pseudomonadota bacterium]
MFTNIPNIRHLRVFIEVAKAGGISQASSRVFLSQPAMTQAIAKLEKMLDVKLFDRQTSGMYLTDAGKLWMLRVERAFDYLIQGFSEIQAHPVSRRLNQGEQALSQITTTQLKALVAVSDAQNFSVAGRALGVSQSSLHRACRDLESVLGVALFEKTSLGIASTKFAKSLTKNVKLSVSELHQGLQELSGLGDRQEVGRLRIGSMPLARTSLMPSVINQFSRDFPGITLELVDGPYEDLLTHLLQGDLDILVGALRFPPPTDELTQEELISPPLAVVGRKGHPAIARNDLTPTVLMGYGWVVPRSRAPTRQLFEDLIVAKSDIEVSSLIETSSQVLIRELLMGSDRLTLISRHQVEYELMSGALEVIPFELSHTRRPIGITHRTNWQPTSAQQKIIDMFRYAASLYSEDE